MVLFRKNSNKIPWTGLPYAFQKRITTLAPLKIVKDLAEVCPIVKKFRPIRPKPYDQVFVTDNANVHRWASKDTFKFKIFKFLYQFAFLRYLFDGNRNVNPIWQDVLRVDDIVSKRQHIYVEDTLVLYCDTMTAYQNVIPFICGPYTRLILHGTIVSIQVKRLVHPGVKKVRISARLVIPPDDYDDFAEFVVKQVHGFNSKFSFIPNDNYPHIFKEKLTAACRRRRHWFVRGEEAYVIERRFFFCWILTDLLLCAICSCSLFSVGWFLIPKTKNFFLFLVMAISMNSPMICTRLFWELFYHPRITDTINASVLQNTN